METVAYLLGCKGQGLSLSAAGGREEGLGLARMVVGEGLMGISMSSSRPGPRSRDGALLATPRSHLSTHCQSLQTEPTPPHLDSGLPAPEPRDSEFLLLRPLHLSEPVQSARR